MMPRAGDPITRPCPKTPLSPRKKMSMTTVTRRGLLQLGVTGAAVLGATALPARTGAQTAPRVRRDVNTPAAETRRDPHLPRRRAVPPAATQQRSPPLGLPDQHPRQLVPAPQLVPPGRGTASTCSPSRTSSAACPKRRSPAPRVSRCPTRLDPGDPRLPAAFASATLSDGSVQRPLTTATRVVGPGQTLPRRARQNASVMRHHLQPDPLRGRSPAHAHRARPAPAPAANGSGAQGHAGPARSDARTTACTTGSAATWRPWSRRRTRSSSCTTAT